MFRTFEPSAGRAVFFDRRRGPAGLLTALTALAIVSQALCEHREETVAVVLEPEIKDLVVEEEPEEPEPEPPPPAAQVKVVKNPRPTPKVQTPIEMVEDQPREDEREKVLEVTGSGSGGGLGSKPKPAAAKPPPPKPEAPPPAPKAAVAIDPTKPIDRPENATEPVPDPGNAAPSYPDELREKGITGVVVVKIHIHFDGTVKGAKILRAESTATTDEEKKQAESLFKKAVVKVLPAWKYKPALLDKKTPISVWKIVNFPFEVTTD